jgi:hypothetical protein
MPAIENKASDTITIACPPDVFLRLLIIPQNWTPSAEVAPNVPLVKLTGFAPGQSIASAELNGVEISISIRSVPGRFAPRGGNGVVKAEHVSNVQEP